ncbi:MAG: M14 family zinc carboxypeptidase [Eubacterium sp.]
MASQKNKKQLIWILLVSLFFVQMPATIVKAQTTVAPSATPYPTPFASVAPTVTPTATITAGYGSTPTTIPTAMPSTEPSQTPKADSFILSNKNASRRIGENKMEYRILSYVTDTVVLKTSHKARFEAVGDTVDLCRRGVLKIEKNGRVKCTKKAKGKAQNCRIKVTEADGEHSFIVTIKFEKKLENKGKTKKLICQGKESSICTNYKRGRLTFTSSNKKVATVDKKGIITARKKGKTTITVKVKDSEKNEFKVQIIVKEEPWIVNIKDSKYTYEDMTSDLRKIAWKYRGKARLQNLGNSEDGRAIWCLQIGNASVQKKYLINGGIHAREWLNCQMLTHKSEEILREYADYKTALRSRCIYIVPMINPDGVTISQFGFGSIRNPKLRKLCKKNNNSARTWKGNARGVNLNFNCPSGWNRKGKSKKADGLSYPGKKASSEKEIKAMMGLVNRHSGWSASLNYHSTGSILYWNYNVESQATLYERQKALAKKVNEFTHYRLMPKSISTDPNGGFGDWLIYSKKIPNVTVETGSVMAPLPYSQLKKIQRENSELLSWFVK